MSNLSNFFTEFAQAYRTPVYVRWSDLDELGMVNNAVFVTYLEEARAHLFLKKLEWNWTETGVVVANLNINYKQPLLYQNQPEAFLRVKKIGNSSFVLHTLIAEIGKQETPTIFADADVTMVAYDLQKKKPTAIPEKAAEVLKTYLIA
jgi:acyl-CoA thioester hydrolase